MSNTLTFHMNHSTPVWFTVEEINPAALPTALIENLSEGSFDVEIESSDIKGGTLSALMSPTTVQPLGAIKTDVPKIPAGESAIKRKWCKMTISNAVKEGLIASITIQGLGRFDKAPTE